MEQEVVIKVTRLRRRLSVEADDVKSSSTQSTPTKKRGGRLAAKPQLELIDENAPEAAPKKTTKSTVKEAAETAVEKVATPSRRSTRVRSNTSIVSETPGDAAEDKGTPSRRSTRIKSNTSLIAEPVNMNSPRAMRAARRLSQVGSDNEAPITPARQTRRTRKDSTSSIDKPVEPAGKLDGEIKEVIVEESENVKETKTTDTSKNDSPSLRKSPRLGQKSNGKSLTLDNDNKENEPGSDKKSSETTSASVDKSVSEAKAEAEPTEVKDQKAPEKIDLSATSKNLIQDLEEAPKKAKNIFNRSTTAVKEPQIKIKRNRTKSWTTISVESPHESNFCSDSEASKKRNKKKKDTLNFSNISGSGDGHVNVSSKTEEANEELENVSLNISALSNKKKKKKHEISMSEDAETSVHEVSVLNTSVNKSVTKISEANEGFKDIIEEKNSLNSSDKHNSSVIQKLFEHAPSGVVQSLVFIEDSNSNHEIGKENNDKSFDNGDQCVPVVDHQLAQDEISNLKSNLSYEPMDIDETMPENVSLSNFINNDLLSHKGKELALDSRKSLVDVNEGKNDSINKSKRKSSMSNMTLEDIIDQESNKSVRKSSISEITNNVVGDNNKSKRKSSISNVASEDAVDGISNVSNNKSLLTDTENHDKSINKKSKRKSSISYTDEESRKSLNTDKSINESMSKESNKSKRKSSISNIVPDEITNKISNKSTNKSSVPPDLVEDENFDKSLNKSERKSSVTAMIAEVSTDKVKTSVFDGNDDIVNKSANKSKRKSSITHMPINDGIEKNCADKSNDKSTLHLDNSDNDNKSTLVLSQLKDTSESEVNTDFNVAKDSNDSNEQLSKSVIVPNIATEKDTDKNNLSLTYSTSTPLQQKTMKKLGLHINSSIITPNSASKIEEQVTANKKKNESSVMSQGASDSSVEEEDSENESEEDVEDLEEESSFKKNKMVDDEAEEASDDYESGDSRDEDEKEYERQNEIREKGETLDSDEEDFSDDDDYEKDSFIVSSDEEDNGLLSGSDDDLSMSADELTMTAKSKKKFNERKIKEQKKASREMYEARHKVNGSDKSTKSKKNNRQRLDTSSSESDEEVAQPKKHRRQRINSSHEASALQSDADQTLSKKKQKIAKLLSESESDENEKEITICNENQTEKVDPLTLNVIKEEPKTPQKELNISTVAVTNMDEVEEVDVDENVNQSIMKATNQTSDPLQATIAENDEENNSDEGSISENEEITQNYESVLQNLNKTGSKKIKSSNISLDLNKKIKQKSKEPIVDELNLTQVKKSKKKKAETTEAAGDTEILDKSLNNKSLERVNKQDTLSEGSSDSIDIKLLFPEDSNDSEVVIDIKNQSVNKTTQKEVDEEAPEDFIPLKKSQGKTNIFENMDNFANKSNDESKLNVSGKKQKNKRKSLQTEETVEMTTPEDSNLSFFVDTTGTHTSKKADANTSVKSSAKKNKQKNNVSFVNIDDDSNDAPLEVSYRSEKNKSKQDLNITQNNDEIQEDSAAAETPNKSAKKKKNKKGMNTSQNIAEISVIKTTDNVAEKSFNTSVANEEGSAKKKKKRLSESQVAHEIENATPIEPSLNISLGSAKKQMQKSTTESTAFEMENVNIENEDIGNHELVAKKRKRKSSANQTIDEIIIKDDVKQTKVESIATKNQKKKRKISKNDDEIETQVDDLVAKTQEQEKPLGENTKKKSIALQNVKVDEVGAVATKKNKKRKDRDDDDASEVSKVPKQNSFDKVHVPRLPANIIKQLDEKPNKVVAEAKKPKVVSTSEFIVQETKRRRTKPSNYLEESVYCINDDADEKKQKRSIKNPKVLPFIPTAATSDSGFTTNFKVNVISETKFVAQSSDVSNFKNDYLLKKRIKKLGTFEMYKRQRNIKIAKF